MIWMNVRSIDIFQVETADCLSPLHHIIINHDNTGLGAGWFCEKVKFPVELSS